MMSEKSIKFRTILISLLTIWILIIIELLGIFIITEEISAGGPTDISGLITQDTIWTKANSPYIIKNNTTFKAGNSLTIQAGTIIKFVNNTQLTIRGTLRVKGSKSDRVVFTANGASYNYSKNYLDSQGFAGRIKYNKTGTNYMIYIAPENDDIISISYAKFEYSADCALHIDGHSHDSIKKYVITDTIFINNNKAIFGALSLINQCIFENNVCGIDGGSFLMLNSTFKNNVYGMGGCGEFAGYNCSFFGNIYGFLGGNSITFENNMFSNNTIGVSIGTGNLKFKKNSIFNNTIGIVLESQGGYEYIDYNNIFNNSKYNFRIKLYESETIIKNNWWGTTNTTIIEQYIYDIYDDNNLGEVIYKPFLTSPVDTTFKFPIAEAGPDQKVTINQKVIFNGNGSYSPEGNNLYYKWDFGDGNSTSWSGSYISTHSYVQPGTYTVILEVKYDELIGLIDKCSIRVTYTPIANAGTNQSVIVNQKVYFDGRDSFDSDGDILIYKWDFGNGNSTNFQNNSKASNSYNFPGNYTVSLFVSDGKFIDKDTCQVFVLKPNTNNQSGDANSNLNTTTNNGSSNENDDQGIIFGFTLEIIIIIIITLTIILIIFYFIKNKKQNK
jgi:hypothetical protein